MLRIHFWSANEKIRIFGAPYPELLVNDILRRVALGTRMGFLGIIAHSAHMFYEATSGNKGLPF